MTSSLETDAGRRYAFAPHPDLVKDILYRIHLVVEAPDGPLWSTETELMEPSMESAEVLAEDLNSRLGLDHATWTAFSERVFAARRRATLDPETDAGAEGD